MTPVELLWAVLGPAAVAGLLAAAALAYVAHRDPGAPATPDWDMAVAADRAEPARPPGAHRAEHWSPDARAHELIAATSGSYSARHGFDEVPPSIVRGLELMDPAARARELVRQLGQSGWWPHGGQVDRRVRIRLRAWAIARRNGLQPLFGTFDLQGVLP